METIILAFIIFLLVLVIIIKFIDEKQIETLESEIRRLKSKISSLEEDKKNAFFDFQMLEIRFNVYKKRHDRLLKWKKEVTKRKAK